MEQYGKKVWFFPDGDRPPLGDSPMKGHESIVILNPNQEDAEVIMTFYYEDKAPREGIKATVKAQRVKCLQTHNTEHMNGEVVPVSEQYALKVSSTVPVIVQYGRLDARQENLAYYTVMGYPFE